MSSRKRKLSSSSCSNNGQNGEGDVASASINPVLLPEVLTIIFSWLDSDAETLRNCRMVCQIWDEEACKVLKQCSNRARITCREELESFHYTVSKLISRRDIINGLTFVQDQVFSGHALYPLTSQFWKVLTLTGNYLTSIDLTTVFLMHHYGGALCNVHFRNMFKLSDLKRLLTLTPNLTHLVLRELPGDFIAAQNRFLPLKDSSEGGGTCVSKLKSLTLRNQLDTIMSYEPCPRFYKALLSSFPNLEEVGYYFLREGSSIPYINALLEKVEKGHLQKLKIIEKFIFGAERFGDYADSIFTSDLITKFKKISLRSNIEFIPAQLFNCFKSSSASVKDLKILGFYYDEKNYSTSVRTFDENRHPIRPMGNLKRLCLRGGIPLEPFLLNAPNLEELTFSFFGVKTDDYKSMQAEKDRNEQIKFFHAKWLEQPLLQPMQQLKRLDIGHCTFICADDIKVIAGLFPNIRELCVPSSSNGCISAVFKDLVRLQELDIILLGNESELTDAMIIGDPDASVPGICAMLDLTALRIRVNEASKSRGVGFSCYQIVQKCMLTDALLTPLKKMGNKLITLILEAGKFSESALLSLDRESFPRLRRLAIPRFSEIPYAVLLKLRDQFPLSNVNFASYEGNKESQEIAWSGLKTTTRGGCNWDFCYDTGLM